MVKEEVMRTSPKVRMVSAIRDGRFGVVEYVVPTNNRGTQLVQKTAIGEGREKMTESTGENKFSELFGVITKYSQMDYDHQEQALRVIAGVYDVPFEAEAMPDARQVVDDILGQHDYVFTIDESGHTLDPHSIDAVVRVALYREENREWGINRLSRMLEGLVRKLNTEEGYPDYVEDSARIIDGLQTVVSGAWAEEIVEELVEDIAEDLEEGA